ncbi:MAG TPA: hypothetical protein VNX26_16400 [Candidatus Acidoferrum sp.]|jgi:hypothetical protein|nr:hypothetical protein [Candidatus Acidoferrum sp.]
MKLTVRHAKIDESLRATFEQLGVVVMQQLQANGHIFLHERTWRDTTAVRDSLLPWLTEQYDRAERKETWSILMEIAIVILVAAELTFSVIAFVQRLP